MYNFGNYAHHIIGDNMIFKKISLYVFLIAIILLNLTIIQATNKNNNNINSYFRLHIVANSDNIDDQLVKLNVSKEVNEYIKELIPSDISKQETKKILTDNILNILKICSNTIKENGKYYDVKAYIGNIQYDYKTYNEYSFDSGIYDSLKIVIGEGKGNNWWSLIYPGNMDIDEYLKSDTTCSFKVVEIIKKIFNLKNKKGSR